MNTQSTGDTLKLLSLANSSDGKDRDQLLLMLSDLGQSSDLDPALSGVMSDVMVKLTKKAEIHVRTILSRRLASSEWASDELILFLAKDETKVAEPVILNSPKLTDDMLIGLMDEVGKDHHMMIARRPNLGERVSGKIVQNGEPDVLEALTWNHSAIINDADMKTIAAISKEYPNLQASTLAHPELPQNVASQMYEFVAGKLKEQILTRFKVDEATLMAELSEAKDQAKDNSSDVFILDDDDSELNFIDEPLIERLLQSGRLNPSFLIATLKDGKLGMFEHALARMSNIDTESVRKATRQESAYYLALAMKSVGVEHKNIPASVALVVQLLGRTLGPNIKDDLQRAFDVADRKEARERFMRDVKAA